MIKWIKMALRNILKNKRRSLTTLMAISVGFAAVSLFYGYTNYVYWGIRQSAIRGEGLGHLTIYKKGWLEKGKINPDEFMFSRDEINGIIDILDRNTDVLLATPQLQISGLVSNGRSSTIFLANGVIPRDEKTIKGSWGAYRPTQGQPMSSNKPYGVEMSMKLAELLDMKPGSIGVVMAPTLDGQMNALDIEVAGVFDTGTEATNDKYIRLPFAFAQSLYDTEKADRIIVLLNDWKITNSTRDAILTELDKAGIFTEIKTWDELSNFFKNVKSMFDMIFMFLFSIVLIIVLMSLINTMSMAVVERTREIGTLRVLGLKRKSVGWLFAVEGGLIGILGIALGILLNILIWYAIEYIKPTYIPPGNSSPVPLVVNLIPEAMAVFSFTIVVLSLLAAMIPARRAAGQNVVTALGHV